MQCCFNRKYKYHEYFAATYVFELRAIKSTFLEYNSYCSLKQILVFMLVLEGVFFFNFISLSITEKGFQAYQSLFCIQGKSYW